MSDLLDTLTRDELLALVRMGFPPSRRDILRARCDVAVARWRRLQADADAAFGPVVPAAGRLDRASAALEATWESTGPDADAVVDDYAAALTDYKALTAAAHLAQSKADRAWAAYVRASKEAGVP